MARTEANKLKKGNYFINPDDNQPYMVQTNDHSKSGKHGHAKNRIGCVGLFNKSKKSLTFTSGDSLDIPEILKKQGQLILVDSANSKCQVMDLADNMTYDVDFPLDEEDTENLNKLKEIEANPNLTSDTLIEYWDVMGRKFVTRVAFAKQ